MGSTYHVYILSSRSGRISRSIGWKTGGIDWRDPSTRSLRSLGRDDREMDETLAGMTGKWTRLRPG